MKQIAKLYLIGSLRNDRIPKLAERLREELPDVEIFDDWYSAGPEADDFWKEYEQGKNKTYKEALKGYAAKHVFEFDKHHLDTSSHCILVLPAGKSGHMEVMYAKYAVGAKTAILLDPTDIRWDVMYQFVDGVLDNDDQIKDWVNDSGRCGYSGGAGIPGLDIILNDQKPHAGLSQWIRRHGLDTMWI